MRKFSVKGRVTGELVTQLMRLLRGVSAGGG
jgi:hypothetical protein